MQNNATRLTFGGDQHRVALDPFQYLCSTLTAAAEQTIQILVSGGVSVRLDIVATPQPGSIVFQFDPQFIFNVDFSTLSTTANSVAKDALEELGSMAAIGAFAWTVLFGGRGIMDLFKRKEAPPPSGGKFDLRTFLIQQALQRDSLRGQLQTIIQAAASAGVHSVTIQVDDSEVVILWDQSTRKESGLIFTRIPTRGSAPEFIKRVSQEVISGTYRRKPVKIFMADGSAHSGGASARYAVVWASTHPVPAHEASNASYVTSQILHSADDLDMVDDVPRDFEGAEAVVLVTKAASMG